MSTRTIVNSISTPTASQELRKLQGRAGDSDFQTDSGYATQSSSPDRNSNSQQSSRSLSNAVDRTANPVRPLSSRPGPAQNLAEFDKHVDNDTISRFSHIQSQIEKPLLKYVCKVPGRYRSMAIRLMVLGTSESEAKPYIVVLAPEDQCKRVRKFFDKSSVQALCQPGDSTTPSFEVLVYGRPPKPKGCDDDIDVLVPLINGSLGYTSDTYCGAPIIVRQPSGVEKRATFGGIVKAVSKNGDFKLYGLTAGHVVGDTDDDLSIQSATDTVAHSDDLSISESDSASDTDGSVEETQEAAEDVELFNEPEKALALQDDSSASWSSLELVILGNISKQSPHVSPGDGKDTTWFPGENFDWALVEMTKYKPNRLRPRSRTTDEGSHAVASTSGDLVMPPPRSDYIGIKKSVVVISGSEGPKRGHISALPSRLLLHPGRKFVNSLVVNLEDNKRIVDGDSGSWVVNERTLQVYGHVVAADAFGGGYIMPLNETFRDIKNRLSVTSVELASVVDIASVMMLKITDASLDLSTASPPLPNPSLGETTSTTKAVGNQDDNRSTVHGEERDANRLDYELPSKPSPDSVLRAHSHPYISNLLEPFSSYDYGSVFPDTSRDSPRIDVEGNLHLSTLQPYMWSEMLRGSSHQNSFSDERYLVEVPRPSPSYSPSRSGTQVEDYDSAYGSSSSLNSTPESCIRQPKTPADAYASDSGYYTGRSSDSNLECSLIDLTEFYKESSLRRHNDRKDRDNAVCNHKSRGNDKRASSPDDEGVRR